MGALYGGYKGGGAGRRKIATTDKAVEFISRIMKEVDELYEKSADLLCEMYRHGTVHLYRPHELKRSDGRVLSWLAYKGPRETWVNALPALKVRHLQPVPKPKHTATDYFPVSITCLYEDLLQAVDVFWEKLQGDATLHANWRSAADALCEPEETRLSW